MTDKWKKCYAELDKHYLTLERIYREQKEKIERLEAENEKLRGEVELLTNLEKTLAEAKEALDQISKHYVFLEQKGYTACISAGAVDIARKALARLSKIEAEEGDGK